jgi:hypothetical protein
MEDLYWGVSYGRYHSNLCSNRRLWRLLCIPVTPVLIAPYGDNSLPSEISCHNLPPLTFPSAGLTLSYNLFVELPSSFPVLILCAHGELSYSLVQSLYLVAFEFPRPNPLHAWRVRRVGLWRPVCICDTCSGGQVIRFLGASP